MNRRTFLDSIAWRPVKLSGGEDCPSFGVLKCTGHTEENGALILAAAKLDTNVWGNVLIAGETGIAAGSYGLATDQMTIALCDSGATPANGESWGIKSGQWKLYQHRPGFRIASAAIGTGAGQRAIVRPFEVTTLWGVFSSTLTFGGSATFTVYFRDGAAWTSSAEDITVYDRLLISGQSIASGKWGVAFFYGDRWWAQEAQCPG